MDSNRRVRILGQRARLASLALLAGLAVACASASTTPSPPVVFEAYRVGAPDQLAITVLPAPAIQETAIVRPDGKITIQLLGDIAAAGRTPAEIGAEIEQKIARFKRGARATVSVLSANSSTITVFGEVRGPGTFAIQKNTRVAEALGTAGGPTTFASLGSIHIVRGRTGGTDVIPIDLRAIRGGDMTTNVQVYAGDIIYVPPTVLAQIGYAFQAVLFPLQPLLGLANSVAGSAIAP